MKKLCFFGPESTGKSVMAGQMATRYNTVYVPEVARELITSNNFTLDDIARIAEAHHQRIVEMSRKANRVLFCDTDAITTEIYSRHYLGEVPEIVFHYQSVDLYDHYFLFDIDVPWVSDGLRDLGDRRSEMFNVFRNALDSRGLRYTVVSGPWEQRRQTVETFVDHLLNE